MTVFARSRQMTALAQRISALLLTIASPAWSQSTLPQEYGDLIRSQSVVGSLDASLLGERIDYDTGQTDFATTDVNLPGNSALPVSVSRRYRVRNQAGGVLQGEFGDWELDLPHIEGTIATNVGWTVSGPTPNATCSGYSAPPAATVTTSGGVPVGPGDPGGPPQTSSVSTGAIPNPTPNTVTTVIPASQYFSGYSLYMPGQGNRELLQRASGNTQQPTNGTYPIVTKDWWMASCTSATLYPGVTNLGEGFAVYAPDGTIYTFDHLTQRPYSSLNRPADTATNGVTATLTRSQIRIYPSSITDRFGNKVTFTYSSLPVPGAYIWQLDKISADDGRTISLSYGQGTHKISSVFDGTRTWNYGYASMYGGNPGALTSVTLPDASSWMINFTALNGASWTNATTTLTGDCTALGAASLTTPVSGTIQHPTGALGTFTFAVTRHGRSGVPASGNCIANSAGVNFAANQPSVFDVLSLTKKQITGPNINTLTWSLGYSGCTTTSCNPTKTTLLTDARNYSTLYTFGAAYNDNEGMLQQVDSGGTGGSGYLQTEKYTYASASGQSYPTQLGTPTQVRGDDARLVSLRPVSTRTITVDGATYTQTKSNLDEFGFPQTITRTGSGATKTDTITYTHNKQYWVLGPVTKRINGGGGGSGCVTSCGNGGTEEFSMVPNTQSMPTQISVFGRVNESIGYFTNGLIYWVKDGDGHQTIYTSYMRGIPQSVSLPDGGSESAGVDNIGNITSITDPYTNVTGFGHDLMGRLNRISPPGGYNPTGITWNTTSTGWTRTETRGSYQKTDTYDAFLHAVTTNDSRAVNRTFDPDGRATFVSYPGASVGTTSVYDGLGRLQSQEDSGGHFTTYTPSANAMTVKDRNGNSTKYDYLTYDQPSTAWPTTITAPLNTTTISRDTWGKPLLTTRGSVTRGRTYYTTNQLLQTTTDPESGTTTYSNYDGAGNVRSIQHTDGTTETRGYDARNRLNSITYSTGDPAVSILWRYDGQLDTATRGTITRSHGYTAGLLTSETVTVGSTPYALGYGYDLNQNPSKITYPDNTVVDYSPNALGQPQKVGAYATSLTYWPNNAIKSFTYGNGISHSLTQTADGRQLPYQSIDTGVYAYQYSYDNNGNPLNITDQGGTGASKVLTYDAENRLSTANASGLWGNTTFTYDTQDNLTKDVTGSTTTSFSPDSTNKIAAATTAGVSSPIAYDGRGNIKSFSGSIYTYDAANELTSVSHPVANLPSTNSSAYLYDVLGMRTIVSNSYGDATPSNEVDIYGTDGKLYYSVLNAGYQICLGVCPPPPILTKYLYLGNHLVAKESNDGSTVTDTYVHTDALGSPIATTDKNKAVLGTTKYLPYGGLYASTGTGNREGIGYAGQSMDPTGLIYMHARYYNPQLRRFMSMDPQGVDTSSALNFNRYSYAANSPYANFDPSGRCAAPAADVPAADGAVDDGSPCPWDQTDSSQSDSSSPVISFLGDTLDTVNQLAMALPGPIGQEVGAAEGLTVVAAEEIAQAAAPVLSEIEAGVQATESFFTGTIYTSKVLEQMGQGAGEFHSFSESVTAFENAGYVSTITGGDGVLYNMLEIPGGYLSSSGNWYDGAFQFIKDVDGSINHRLFVPDLTQIGHE